MASQNALRDSNNVPSLLLESSTVTGETVRAKGDATTGRLLVDSASGAGTVTSVSVVSANGFAGTVATATTTPAITLTTTVTGILSGNGTAISAASTTGSGSVVLATTPTLVTPVIGVATGTSLDVTGVLESGANGGTGGQLTLVGATSGSVAIKVAAAAGAGTVFQLPANNGTNTYVLQTDGAGVTSWVAAGTGTVTAVSVASANGFAGTSSGGATPALTLSTTITGVLKGNGTAISAATAGSDYAVGSIGLAGGQTIAGSTLTNENLTLRANAADLTTGQINVTSSKEATDTTTASVALAGGLAVAKRVYALDMTVTNAITGSITGNAATVTWADEAADTTCFIGFATAASGSLAPKTNTNMTFNSNTGVATFASTVLTTTDINGGTVDGATIGSNSASTIVGTTITANTGFLPDADGGAYLGQATQAFSGLFLDTTATINFDNGNAVITHSSGILTVSTGDLRVTTAGTNTASAVTVGGTQTLTSKTLTSPTITTATFSGTQQFAEGAGIAYDAASSADGVYSGFVRAGTAGATLAFGDLVYLSSVDSRWELADADAATTSDRFLGMCVLAAAADGDPTTILLTGFIRADAAFPAMTIGSAMYVGETAGDIQVAIPTGADNVIRRVGYAWTADELYFNPSMDSQVTVA